MQSGAVRDANNFLGSGKYSRETAWCICNLAQFPLAFFFVFLV